MCLAIPGLVESIHDDHGIRMGRVNFGGVVREVCLAYVEDVAVGDYTIVHVGFAIARLDETIARETLRTLDELGLLAEGVAELRGDDPPTDPGLRPAADETPRRIP